MGARAQHAGWGEGGTRVGSGNGEVRACSHRSCVQQSGVGRARGEGGRGLLKTSITKDNIRPFLPKAPGNSMGLIYDLFADPDWQPKPSNGKLSVDPAFALQLWERLTGGSASQTEDPDVQWFKKVCGHCQPCRQAARRRAEGLVPRKKGISCTALPKVGDAIVLGHADLSSAVWHSVESCCRNWLCLNALLCCAVLCCCTLYVCCTMLHGNVLNSISNALLTVLC